MIQSMIFHGVYAPIVTPFDQNENISIHSLIDNIEKYNKTSLKGYMPLGSNGEFQGLTDEESFLILDTVFRYKAKDKTVVAGCGRESAFKTLDFIKRAADHGLDVAFILPPHYYLNFMSKDALFQYYTLVAQRSPVPIVIYNAPKFASNLSLGVDLIQELSEHPNIIAMKNSSLEPNINYIRAVPEHVDFSIIAGNVSTFYLGLLEGAAGGVLSTASYLPEYCCELYNDFIQGDYKKAQELHEFLNNVSMQTISRHGVAGVKYGMDLRGFSGGSPRIPLQSISISEQNRIAECFEQFGIRPFKTWPIF